MFKRLYQPHYLRFVALLAFASTLHLCVESVRSQPPRLSDKTLNAVVGQVPARCCLFGRRYGCDPENLDQSGCVPLEVLPICTAEAPTTMACGHSSCRRSSAEDQCLMWFRRVGHNVCQPLGQLTTVGCMEDEYQCSIQMWRYTRPNAPKSDRMVCDSESTICSFDYSACD